MKHSNSLRGLYHDTMIYCKCDTTVDEVPYVEMLQLFLSMA